MARKFFYVCAGLFLLALSYQVGVRSVGAESAAATQEIAVLTGEVADGGTIPLPRYQDGSEALESECFWTVSPQTLTSTFAYAQFERCSTNGRTVRIYWCRSSCGPAGDCDPPVSCGPLGGTANYLIIAVRNTTPTPATRESFGGLKARHR